MDTLDSQSLFEESLHLAGADTLGANDHCSFLGKPYYAVIDGYRALRPGGERRCWAKLVSKGEIFPRHQFILWLAMKYHTQREALPSTASLAALDGESDLREDHSGEIQAKVPCCDGVLCLAGKELADFQASSY
ncbi:hypothetical protein Dimus_036149 [Dionaea muscipula]